MSWRTVAPGAVEEELAALWLEAAASGPVSRALMSNLVVIRVNGDDAGIPDEATVGEVLARHPARAVIVDYAPDETTAAAPASLQINVMLFDGGSRRYGVERIGVRVTCGERSLPSIVRRLAVGSVPTAVWWGGDWSDGRVPSTLTEMGRQIVYDSASWRDVAGGVRLAARLADERHAPDLVDANWRRLEPVRRAIAHAARLDPPTAGALHARVRYQEGHRAAAWLMSGWLRSAGSEGSGGGIDSDVEEGADAGALLSISLEPRGAGGWQLHAFVDQQIVRVRSAGEGPALLFPMNEETAAQGIATELASLRHDESLRRTVKTLASAGPRRSRDC